MSEEQCTHNCADCGADCASKSAAPAHEPLNHLSRVRKVYAVMSGKGGVGKSMVTSLLAVMAQRAGLNVGVLDADVTGPSIPRAFRLNRRAQATDMGLFPVESKTGIRVMSLNLLVDEPTDPVVWRGPVIAGLVKQFWTDVVWGDLDVLFVDLPPGTGDVPLTVFQSLPVDGIILVTSPQELVGMIVEKALKMASLMHVPLVALVENMAFVRCPGCNEVFSPFGESGLSELAERYQVPATARLPIDPKLAAAVDKGMIELFEGDELQEVFDSLLAQIDQTPQEG